jgi:hypothetical protein
MDGDPDGVELARLHDDVAEALTRLGELARASDDAVRLERWPSALIRIGHWEIAPVEWGEERWDSGIWSARIALAWQFETAFPATMVMTTALGEGLDRDRAAADAIAAWAAGTAPAMLSELRGQAMEGVDIWPAEDSPVAGLRVVAGPPLFAGLTERVADLRAHHRTRPLLEALGPQLAATLDRARPFHTLSLYRAVTPTSVVAEVWVDDQPDADAGRALVMAVRWPDHVTATPFLSLRVFLLLARPAGRAMIANRASEL